jgi:hypothetical protein
MERYWKTWLLVICLIGMIFIFVAVGYNGSKITNPSYSNAVTAIK